MSTVTVRGTVESIEETKSYGQKGFRKRRVVLKQRNGRFENFIPVEFTGDSCDQVDELEIGMEIDVIGRLSGRKWQRDQNSEVQYFLSFESMEFTSVELEPFDDGNDPNEDCDLPF